MNRLTSASSPYLLQHKDNPVHWWEWGPDALAEAQRLNRPVLLSIGYAACHWCHVMAHESFEDEATAALTTHTRRHTVVLLSPVQNPGQVTASKAYFFGSSTLSVDGYFGLGIQPSDIAIFAPHHRLIVRASEALRKFSDRLPAMRQFADSVYVTSRR